MNELKRHYYGTVQLAIAFFVWAKAQGFSPSLIESPHGWEVVIYE